MHFEQYNIIVLCITAEVFGHQIVIHNTKLHSIFTIVIIAIIIIKQYYRNKKLLKCLF